MSRRRFDDNCAGCRPVILNPDSGQAYPADHPVCIAAMRVWNESALYEREACHNVWCKNSRLPRDVRILNGVMARLQALGEQMIRQAQPPVHIYEEPQPE